MSKKILMRYVVVVAWMISLLAGFALADVMNFTVNVPAENMKNTDGTPVSKGEGLVQVIKGAGSCPSAVATDADSALTGGETYAKALVAPFANQDIKGKVGDYVAEAGAGGFFIANQVDVPIGTKYYVRYWTKPQADGFVYYGNFAAKTPWAAGLPVPFDEPFTNYSFYKASTPPAPTAMTATLTGYTADPVNFNPDKPIVDMQMTVDVSKHQVTAYEFKVQKINPQTEAPVGDPIIIASGGKGLQDKTKFALNSSYLIQGRAKNNFDANPNTWGPVPGKRIDIGGIPTGPINLEYSLGPGIVQFALSVDPAKEIKLNGNVMANKNIDELIKGLGAVNKISTFGWWDGQKPVGYIITWNGNAPAYQSVNGTPANAQVLLEKDKVYQMALSDKVSFTLTGTR